MLEVDHLSVSYGNIVALRDVSLRVESGEVVVLIGSNGAGKSTLIKALAGLVTPARGDIRFLGNSLLKRPAHARARAGISVVPENRRLFGDMTVVDNLLLGAYSRSSYGRAPETSGDLEQVFQLFPRLAERRSQIASTLSGGEQQMLAIGRALMSRPKVMLMDEPSVGLAPLIVRDIFEAIEKLRHQGRTILLVEQNAAAGLRIADRAYVLELGRVTLEGGGSELWAMESVRSLYLGGDKQ
ncbi:MAG: ABC transporter ATP-binding protein [Burkholderiales bacterium]|nr:MAG: ABC transporter ATP-binding protein [Burkholderiales bacterium]